MKCNQSRPGFELVSPCPFPTTITITPRVTFKLIPSDQDKSWTLHKVCKSCVENLRMWTKGSHDELAFGIPIIWRDPQKIIVQAFTFVLWKLHDINARSSTLVFHQQYVKCLIQLKSHSYFSFIYLFLKILIMVKIWIMMKNSVTAMRQISKFKINQLVTGSISVNWMIWYEIWNYQIRLKNF